MRLSLIKFPSAGGSGSGTVTSVGLALPNIFTISGSPVTTAGTLTGTLASQSANLIFASPNGSAGVPSFRQLVVPDISFNIKTVSGNYSILTSDFTVIVDTSAGDVTITIDPTLKNFLLNIKKKGADGNNVIISATSGKIFADDGGLLSTYTFNSPGESIQLQSDLTNLYLL